MSWDHPPDNLFGSPVRRDLWRDSVREVRQCLGEADPGAAPGVTLVTQVSGGTFERQLETSIQRELLQIMNSNISMEMELERLEISIRAAENVLSVAEEPHRPRRPRPRGPIAIWE